MKKIFKSLFLLFTSPFALFGQSCGWNPPQSEMKEIWKEKVILSNQKPSYHFHDGDTLIYKDKYKINAKPYQIYGIDTPELTSFNGKIWKDASPYEKQWANKALVEATKWWNKKDNVWIITLQNKKTYDRISIKIRKYSMAPITGQQNWVNDLGLFLISNGLARVRYILTNQNNKYHTVSTEYYNELKAAQTHAKSNKKGFWKESKSPFILKTIITD